MAQEASAQRNGLSGLHGNSARHKATFFTHEPSAQRTGVAELHVTTVGQRRAFSIQLPSGHRSLPAGQILDGHVFVLWSTQPTEHLVQPAGHSFIWEGHSFEFARHEPSMHFFSYGKTKLQGVTSGHWSELVRQLPSPQYMDEGSQNIGFTIAESVKHSFVSLTHAFEPDENGHGV